MTGEPGGDVIGTERLLLTPLRPEDTDEMVEPTNAEIDGERVWRTDLYL